MLNFHPTVLSVPVKLLKEGEGHVVTAELKSGDVYRGLLVESEDTMNVQLSEGKQKLCSSAMLPFCVHTFPFSLHSHYATIGAHALPFLLSLHFTSLLTLIYMSSISPLRHSHTYCKKWQNLEIRASLSSWKSFKIYCFT